MSDLSNAISDETLRDYDCLREDCGLVPLPHIALVELTGEDRKGWLQGQVTQNVRRLEAGNSASFCFSAPTGHLIAAVDAWALADRILMTTATETRQAVLNRIEQMVVLEDVEGHDTVERFALYSVQGPTASKRLAELVNLPSLDAGTADLAGATVVCLRADRNGFGGWDIAVPADASDARQVLEKNFRWLSTDAYEVARLEAGLPMYGRDMNERTLPPEMGAAFEARHVSYNKGCYVGQEVLMRIHSRGHTNRTWMGLMAERPLEAGATVLSGKREVGTVTSAVFSPDYGYIAGAMLRNEVAQPRETVVVKTAAGDVEAEVRPMPILRLD